MGVLVPMDKVWRAGVDENTTFEVSDQVPVEGKPLPKVTTACTHPGRKHVDGHFLEDGGAWGSYSYDKAEDALRVEVKPQPLPQNEEALEYKFEDPTANSVTVTMKWEKLSVPFHVTVNDADSVFPGIRLQLRGRAQYTWEAPNEAANFALEKKTNLEEGLKWADLSIHERRTVRKSEHESGFAQSDEQTGRSKKGLGSRGRAGDSCTNVLARAPTSVAATRRRSDGDFQKRSRESARQCFWSPGAGSAQIRRRRFRRRDQGSQSRDIGLPFRTTEERVEAVA